MKYPGHIITMIFVRALMESTRMQQTVCARQYTDGQISLVQPKLKVLICYACSSCFNLLSGAEEFKA